MVPKHEDDQFEGDLGLLGWGLSVLGVLLPLTGLLFLLGWM